MPTYLSNAYLSQGGKVFKPGERIELSEEQAERLGDKVEVSDDPTEGKHDEKSFRKLGAEEQKAVVEQLNGDLEEHSNEDKRWEYVSQNQ
jgi:hypothetical protein